MMRFITLEEGVEKAILSLILARDQGRREAEDPRKCFMPAELEMIILGKVPSGNSKDCITLAVNWFMLLHLPSSLENLHRPILLLRTLRKISLNFSSVWTTKHWFMLIFKGVKLLNEDKMETWIEDFTWPHPSYSIILSSSYHFPVIWKYSEMSEIWFLPTKDKADTR